MKMFKRLEHTPSGNARSRRSASPRTGFRRGIGWILAGVLVLAALPVSLSAQERIDERRPLAADGRLDVGVVSHDVRVEVWERAEVHLTGTIDPELQTLEIGGSDQSLEINIEHERDRRGGDYGGMLELRVPRDARLTIATVSGDVSLQGVSGTSRASTVSGGIRLEGTPRTAELHTVSGRIELAGPVADLRLHSVSGDIRVRGATGRVEAHSVSGHFDLEADAALERIRVNTVAGEVRLSSRLAPRATVDVESHSGPVTLRLPSETAADYDLSSFTGPILNGVTDAGAGTGRGAKTLRFRVGDGSARVRLNTFSGTITLETMG